MTWITLLSFLCCILASLLINYLADVLPAKRKLARPFCSQCQNPFNWIDYILLKPCTMCKAKRPIRPWIVLILALIVNALIWWMPPSMGYWPALVVFSYFGLVIIIDLEHRLVMHPVSLGGLLLGMGIGIWQHGIVFTLIGGLAGFVIMLALYFLGIGFVRFLSRKTGTPEDSEGIGFGDVILSGVMGIFLGWPGVIAGMVLTILLGGLASFVVLIVLLIRKKYQSFTSIPYAPFIALATVLLLLVVRP